MARRILVTGGSSGLGAATVKQSVKSGNVVIGTSRSAEFPDTICPGEVNMVPLDVCSDQSVSTLISWMSSNDFLPDIVVFNAGSGISGAIEDTSIEGVYAQFDTNFFGVHRLTHALLPLLREQGSGHLIFVSSMGGLVSVPFQGIYSASKFALEAYAEALRAEVMVYGLQVSLIEPGDFNTNFGSGQLAVSAPVSDAYEPQCSRAIQIMRESEKSGSAPEKFAKLVERVAMAHNPKLRYLSGSMFETLMLTLRKFLPGTVIERMVMQIYKIPRK